VLAVSRSARSLLLIACLTFFLGLGRQAITDADEAYYAEASREMVESGDWLTPHFNYVDRWQKPVLYYWLTAAAYLITGPTEFAARLWSALAGLGLVLLTWYAGLRLTARDDAAWLAGAITATSYGYFAMARMALPDLPLAFCITLGIWMALERRWAWAGAAAGLGFLMKGPVALVVPGLVLLPIWWREGTFKTLRVRDIIVAAALFAIIGLPWYGAMLLQHGAAYFESFFIGDNLERFATDRFNEPRWFWFYIPIVIGGLFPWAVYLLCASFRGARGIVTRTRTLTREDWRLLLWAAMPLLFFSVAVGKQPRYILPVLPPLAIMLARSMAKQVEAAPGSGFRAADSGRQEAAFGNQDSEGRSGEAQVGTRGSGLAVPTWLTAALYIILTVLLVRAMPLFISAYPAVSWMTVGALIGCAAALAWVASTRRWQQLPFVMTACAVILLLGVQFGVLSGARPEPVEQMAALVQQHRRAGEPVGAYEVFVRNLVFYTRSAQVELFNEARALDFIKSPERVLMAVSASDLTRLETISGLTLQRLGEVRYLDTASIRLRTLLNPIPEQDIETVYLVSNR